MEQRNEKHVINRINMELPTIEANLPVRSVAMLGAPVVVQVDA
jgi:hypothetical protein